MKRNIHVAFIIYVPHCNAENDVLAASIGYQGDPWISAHIDVLRPSFDAVIPHNALGFAISELFMGHDFPNVHCAHNVQSPLHRRIHTCIHSSVLKSRATSHTRAVSRINVLLNLIPSDSSLPMSKYL